MTYFVLSNNGNSTTNFDDIAVCTTKEAAEEVASNLIKSFIVIVNYSKRGTKNRKVFKNSI